MRKAMVIALIAWAGQASAATVTPRTTTRLDPQPASPGTCMLQSFDICVNGQALSFESAYGADSSHATFKNTSPTNSWELKVENFAIFPDPGGLPYKACDDQGCLAYGVTCGKTFHCVYTVGSSETLTLDSPSDYGWAFAQTGIYLQVKTNGVSRWIGLSRLDGSVANTPAPKRAN